MHRSNCPPTYIGPSANVFTFANCKAISKSLKNTVDAFYLYFKRYTDLHRLFCVSSSKSQ